MNDLDDIELGFTDPVVAAHQGVFEPMQVFRICWGFLCFIASFRLTICLVLHAHVLASNLKK